MWYLTYIYLILSSTSKGNILFEICLIRLNFQPWSNYSPTTLCTPNSFCLIVNYKPWRRFIASKRHSHHLPDFPAASRFFERLFSSISSPTSHSWVTMLLNEARNGPHTINSLHLFSTLSSKTQHLLLVVLSGALQGALPLSYSSNDATLTVLLIRQHL